MSNHPVIDLGLDSGNSGCGCGCPGIILASLVLFFSLSYLHQTNYLKSSSGNLNQVTLSFRPACGSPPNSGSTWYSVVGNSRSIDLVKTKYCGDAFITAAGKLQVASFISKSEAEKFADTLSKITGHKFWVLSKQV
jgi:hypothetical protein